MSEVKRFDHVNHAHVDECEHIENPEGAWVKASDYDALAAKLAMAEDAAAKGDAARQQCGGMEMEIQELRAEFAALRARVVVPDGYALVPIEPTVAMRMPWKTMRGHSWYSKYKAMLEAAPRLNGKTVSEGLLLRVLYAISELGDRHLTAIEMQSARELRALLNQDKESGNG